MIRFDLNWIFDTWIRALVCKLFKWGFCLNVISFEIIPHDELREDVMIWVLETRIFESDQNELQSVVPTLYVVKICGNCILNAKQARNLERCALKAAKLQHGKLKALHTWLISMQNAECGKNRGQAFFGQFSTNPTLFTFSHLFKPLVDYRLLCSQYNTSSASYSGTSLPKRPAFGPQKIHFWTTLYLSHL